jgi:hypothetical protein
VGRAAVAATLLAAALAAGAQEPQNQPPTRPPTGAPSTDPATTPVFPDRIDVAVVNLQVWVTDADGNTVVGLGPEDFELRVDGEPVPLTHFSEVRSERAVRTLPAAPATPVTPPGAESEEQAAAEALAAAAPPEEESLIVYVDELHLGRLARKQAFADLRELVAAGRVEPQRIMVLRQTGRLTAEASFGSPAERIDAVLARLAKPPAAIASPDEKRRLITRVWDLWEESRQRAPFGTDPCQFFVRPTLDEIEAFAREAAAKWR